MPRVIPTFMAHGFSSSSPSQLDVTDNTPNHEQRASTLGRPVRLSPRDSNYKNQARSPGRQREVATGSPGRTSPREDSTINNSNSNANNNHDETASPVHHEQREHGHVRRQSGGEHARNARQVNTNSKKLHASSGSPKKVILPLNLRSLGNSEENQDDAYSPSKQRMLEIVECSVVAVLNTANESVTIQYSKSVVVIERSRT